MTRLPFVDRIFGVLALVYGVVYLMLAFRRAYGTTVGAAIVRTAIVGFAYFIATVIAVMAIVLPTILWHRT
jgi:hypothetical protein